MKKIVYVLCILCIFLVGDAFAKGVSSSGSRSFSSSSSFSSKSSSFSSSSSVKPSTGSGSNSFSSSSSVKPSIGSGSVAPTAPPKFTYKSTTVAQPQKTSWFSSKPKPTVNQTYTIRPRTVAPASYGSYSNMYYRQPYINTDFLMYYMVLDSMSDAAVMHAMSHNNGYDTWKMQALSSDNAELKAKVAALDQKMKELNATGSVSGNYTDPSIESKMKEGTDDTEVISGAESEEEDSDWLLYASIAVLIIAAVILFRRRF